MQLDKIWYSSYDKKTQKKTFGVRQPVESYSVDRRLPKATKSPDSDYT